MKTMKILVPVAASLLFAGQAFAQSDDEAERAHAERKAEYAERLRAAEREMAEAARRVAELTSERLPEFREMQMKFLGSGKPQIGITIDGDEQSGPVEGVEIVGVTPGTAADDADLRTGDIITAVNDESMTASSSFAANKMLFEFMSGVEEGDVLEIDYLRNGSSGMVELSPRGAGVRAFSFAPHDSDVVIERFVEPHVESLFALDVGFPWGSAWGTMELIELNEGLGKYFGTDTGLLVVAAPEPDAFGLEDGDVIQSIDGREPKDVRHALKILGSYSGGETLELGIMREQKKRKLEVEIPSNEFRGKVLEIPGAAKPAVIPMPPRPVHGHSST